MLLPNLLHTTHEVSNTAGRKRRRCGRTGRICTPSQQRQSSVAEDLYRAANIGSAVKGFGGPVNVNGLFMTMPFHVSGFTCIDKPGSF